METFQSSANMEHTECAGLHTGLQPFRGPKLGEDEKASYIRMDSKHPINQPLLSSQMEIQVKLRRSLGTAL